MKSRLLSVIGIFAISAASAAVSASTVYSAKAGFVDSYTTLAQPTAVSGAFTFGYTAPGGTGVTAFDHRDPIALAPFYLWNASSPQDSGVPGAFYNPTGAPASTGTLTLDADQLVLHPGLATDAVLRFTAPAAGTYHFGGTFEGSDNSGNTSTTLSVYKNAAQFSAPQVVSGFHSTTVSYDFVVSLLAGDDIQFNIGNNGSYFYDSTGIVSDLVVTQIPLPAGVWGGGALIAGLGIARKLRKMA